MNKMEKNMDPGSISPRGTFAALQFPNYRLWFFGQMISLVGTWMQSTAQGYLVYTLTGSAAYLGVITFINGVPAWLLMMYGGLIADRIPKRTLMIITQTAMMVLAFIMAALVFTNVVAPWHIAVLAFLLGVANAFDAPARQSFVIELVDREYMTNAIALNATMFNTGTVIGPAIAGITYAAFGPAWCFTINGISFIAVIIGLALMKLKAVPQIQIRRNALAEIKEGIQYVAKNKIIRGLIAYYGFLATFGFGLVALMPVWAVSVLHGDVTTNGYLLSARGIGSLAAGLFLAALGNKRIRGKMWGISTLALPVGWFAFAWITNLPLSLILLGLIGFFLILIANLTNSMVQTHVDDQIRGRVMGIYTMVFFGFSPIGSLISGFSAEHLIGNQWTVAACGLILMAISLFTWFKLPYLREVE